MPEKRPIETEQDLIKALNEMFTSTPPPEGLEESREFIQLWDENPDEIGKKIENLVRRELLWRIQDPSEIKDTQKEIERIPLHMDKSKDELKQMINSMIQKMQGMGFKPALSHYRNQDELSTYDLATLLQEIIFIAGKYGIESGESEDQ